MPTHAERIEGGLIGMLVGDALGVPYEFHGAEEVPPIEQIEMQPPPGFARAHAGVPAGTWCDDGAQALCLLGSLLACGRLDPEDFGRRLLRWYDDGYLAVDSQVCDVGIQTGRALPRLRAGVPAVEAGGTDEQGKGSGSLMRAAAGARAPQLIDPPRQVCVGFLVCGCLPTSRQLRSSTSIP